MVSQSALSSDWRMRPNASLGRRTRPTEARLQGPIHDENDENDDMEGASATPRPSCVRGEDDPRTLQAIEEGRRLYVGNLIYAAKPNDVKRLFMNGGYQIEHINMSIDPFTGRNPSYCFVELDTRTQANQAMYDLDRQNLLGRSVKIGPGVARSRRPTSNEPRTQDRSEAPVFQRWTRTDAQAHLEGYASQGRRLWVGGLPRMGSHYKVEADVRELFGGFDIEAVSKVIIPTDPERPDKRKGNSRYLFVDFASAEEASRAAKATNGRRVWGVEVSVQVTHGNGNSSKAAERDDYDEKGFIVSI